ncbi:MAG: hypothetical protein NW226_04870 [Microscillaceae bacterium]|nr:hypothetical protein [Microscillaceae bacterium]
MMSLRLIVLIILIFNFSNVTSQSNITTRQVVSYYKNGNIRKIENFLTDSCQVFSVDFQDYILVDTCRYGYFKEYYPNGILKILGQYDCDQGKADQTEESCFESSIWYEYDSLGKVNKMTGYDHGVIVFVRYPVKQDVIIVKEDSIWVKLHLYDKINSYLIKRYENNRRLILEFPVMSDHNYWSVYDKQLDILDTGVAYSKKFLNSFKDDDTPENQRYLDVSNLENGRYYVYYKYKPGSQYYHYELEIILKDIID